MTKITIDRSLLEQALNDLQTVLAAKPSGPEKCGHCGRRTIDPPWPATPAPRPERKPMRGEEVVELARKHSPKTLGMHDVPAWIVPFVRSVEAFHGITANM